MDKDWQYAAGLFEAEGCASYSGRHANSKNQKGYPDLSMAMIDQDVMKRFVKVVGYGNLNFHHTPAKQKRGSQPQYRWAISKRSEVERIAQNMAPYLFSRRLARFQELGIIDKVKREERSWPWAAALFDGEGTFFTNGYGTVKTLRVGMIDEEVVDEFAKVVGYGNVCRFHPPSHRDKGMQPTFSWSASQKEEVIRICEEMLPWLGERRRAKIEELGILTFSY